MALPENFNDLTKMADLQKQLEEVTADLTEAETAWEELSLQLEEFQEG